MQADNDKAFPDEMDTPDDVSARVRFSRYRSLQSFRSSPWHPKENLPIDYAKIYQFEDFNGTQRRVLGDGKTLQELQNQDILSSIKSHSTRHSKARTSSFHSRTASQRNSSFDGSMEVEGEGAQEEEMGEDMDVAEGGSVGRSSAPSGLLTGADDYIISGKIFLVE